VAKLLRKNDASTVEKLREAGCIPLLYLPDDGWLVALPPGREVPTIEGVAGWFPLMPQDRIPRDLSPRALDPSGERREIPFLLHLLPGAEERPVVDLLVAEGLPVIGVGREGDRGRVATAIPRGEAQQLLSRLSRLPGLLFAEPVRRISLANDRSVGTVQSGVQGFSSAVTPVWNEGLHGEGQVVGEIDTGIDADSCWFRDPSLGLPPTNGWAAGSGYETEVDPSQRKLIACDFLFSCDQFPVSAGCDDPSNPLAWDDHGHGTHVAGNLAGDDFANPVTHDTADGIAPAAKLVVQDAGYSADDCADLPGIGCPVTSLVPLFGQAWQQGVRIHNDSWGDNENAAAPGQSNYSARARDVDSFVWSHPEMLIVFAAGNGGSGSVDFSVGSPATCKNGIAVGSTRRTATGSDENISSFSARGWSGDGRIKPDLMAPGCNGSAGGNLSVASPSCASDSGCGTSYASPTLAGAAALVRQYFTEGFWPGGVRNPAGGFPPSAALLKALLIASAVPMTGFDNSGMGSISPIPSNEQGWGRVKLDGALAFGSAPARKLYVDDHRIGLTTGSAGPFSYALSGVSTGEPLKVVLVWSDYPGEVDSPPSAPSIGNPAGWSAPRLVNDLDLVVAGPSGTYRGNVFSAGSSTTGGSADARNNVEVVLLPFPSAGDWTISVQSSNVVQGGQEFALVVTGAWSGVTDPLPGAPTGLTKLSGSATSVVLSWSSGTPAGGSYRLWRTGGDPVEGPWTLVGTSTAAPFTDGTVLPDTGYVYRVSALSADGRSESLRSPPLVAVCPPLFAGGASAVADGGATCGVVVSWSPASSTCSGADLVYDLYRDGSPSFVPSPANLVARCVGGSSFHDTGQLVAGQAATWIVRAEDLSQPGSGPCGGGIVEKNVAGATATPVSCATRVGEVSGRGSAVSFRLRDTGAALSASFERLPGATAHNLYLGDPSSYYSHGGSGGNLCAVSPTDPGDGSLSLSFAPPADDRYFLVTAAAGGVEGPSGFASSGSEIPAEGSDCAP
jgi:hypothetical protein